MSSLLQDFRYALRGLRAHASFSVTAVLTLALGIGVTTAMFGVVNGIVLRPLPFANADRLITIRDGRLVADERLGTDAPTAVGAG